MKHSTRTQSATSLPRAPRDEAGARMTAYFLTMGVRVVCFVLMVAITPYSWYTALFAVGAIVLPYIAVVLANVAKAGRETTVEPPQRGLPQTPQARPDTSTAVLRIQEQSNAQPEPRRTDNGPDADRQAS